MGGWTADEMAVVLAVMKDIVMVAQWVEKKADERAVKMVGD